MPKNKDFKRLVRARMKKSGESYAAARHQLLLGKGDSAQPRSAAALAGMRDEAVAAKTGRTWLQWARLLDAVGAASWPHREIARHLHGAHGLPPWWSQTVAVGYERIRGLRDVGQQRTAGRAAAYRASKTRTLPVPRRALYRACRDARSRSEWMPEADLVLRKATPPKYLRWHGPRAEPIEMVFLAKSPRKSTVQIQVGGLPSRVAVEAEKRRWGKRLDALEARLSRPGGTGVPADR
jgi:hypothetical protein